MTFLGAAALATAVALAISCAAPGSRVARALARFAQTVTPAARDARRIRAIAAGLAGATALLVFGAIAVPLAAYAGALAPAILSDRAAAARARRLERGSLHAVEWLDALVASGRPVPTALATIAEHGVGLADTDAVLAEAARAYALGAPLFAALHAEADRREARDLAALAGELGRARDLGRASALAIRAARDSLRERERVRALAAAAGVEAKLMLVLVLCYLPALMLAVVVPLFIGLLAAIGG